MVDDIEENKKILNLFAYNLKWAMHDRFPM